MEDFLQIITLILISSVKFAFGIPFVSISERYTFTWFETNLYAILGGMLGVVVFMYFSDWLMMIWSKLRAYVFRKKMERRELFSPPMADVENPLQIKYEYVDKTMPPRKVFSPRSRKIVRIWSKYGLIGLAALTPIFLSIPIGTFFITRLERNKRKILLYLFVSITLWSLLLTTLFHFANIKTLEDIYS